MTENLIPTYLLVALCSYLLGSIPFGYLLVRIFLKQDIRSTGSGNIGATNVARSGAKGLAIATLTLDAGKGFFAIFLVHLMFLLPLKQDASAIAALVSIAAFFAIAGHVFPVWLKFRGGKGVATGVGAFAALAPKAVMVALVIFLVVVAFTRYVSLGSILAAAVFPAAVFFWPPKIFDQVLVTPPLLVFVCLSSALIIGKHHQNIRRLVAGKESKLGAKPRLADPMATEKNA